MERPPLQAQKSCNFDEFTTIIMHLLNSAWGTKWGTFCEAFPNGTDPTKVSLPVITYTLRDMQPGVIGKDGTREIKARHRATFTTEQNDQGPRVTEVRGRVLDCTVIFEVWEENNAKATKLATKFMNFMDMYTGFIKQQGVKELIFQKLDNNTEAGQWKDDVVCRKFQYLVRLEHLIEIPSDVIEKVTGIVSPLINESDDYIKEVITFKRSE